MLDGEPNVNGHRINVWASPYKNTKAGVTYAMATIDPETTKLKSNQFMVDFEVNF